MSRDQIVRDLETVIQNLVFAVGALDRLAEELRQHDRPQVPATAAPAAPAPTED